MLPKGLLTEHSRSISFVLRGLDVFAMVLAGVIAYYYRFGNLSFPPIYNNAFLLASIFTLLFFPHFHIYDSMRGQPFTSTLKKLFQAILTVLIFLAGLAFITKTGANFSRIWFFAWCISSFGLLSILRFSLVLVLRVMRSHGLNEKRVLIIGAGEMGKRLVKNLQAAYWTGFRVTEILDDKVDEHESSILNIPIKKMPSDLSEYLKQAKNLHEIWIALPLCEEARVKQILFKLRHHTICIRYVLDVFGLGLLKQSITELAGFPTVNVNFTPMVGINRGVKAIEDRLLALIILLCISPLFLMIAVGIKLTSKGPIFFKQLRHGWDGKIIKIYKFRTMVVHQEKAGKVTQASINDDRVTPFGRFLRKTSLDELPQFVNVLQGKMSIVGPRPHAIEHNEYYKESINSYMQRHQVKPGITGWAQVNGWRGETDTLGKMQKRIEYDLQYIEHWSLWFDLKIIFLTLFKGLVNKNAY